MLELLTRLTRQKSTYVVVALLTTIAVVGPSLLHSADSSNSTTSTTDAFFGDSTVAVTTSVSPSTTSTPTTTSTPATTSSPPTTTQEPTSAPTTVASTPTSSTPGSATTVAPTTSAVPEADRPGDPPNPGQLYPGRPDIKDNDQERSIGPASEPARLSGFSVWIVKAEASAQGPDGKAGPFLRITVRIVNRDDGPQKVADTQWSLLRPDGVSATTAYASPALVAGTDIAGNGEQFGEVWFALAGTGRYWLAFRPDQSSARGIWAIDAA